MNTYQSVLDFWFKEVGSQQWWQKDDAFDQLIRERFFDLHQQAIQAELFTWRQTPQGRLAEVIVLDQFSRNLFRDQPESFQYDPMALALAQEVVALGYDLELPAEQRAFLYMPYMHSESALIHQQAVKLFKERGQESNYQFELKHKVIIDRFGRYPHRNAILGRTSTAEEIEFLKQPGSSF